MEEMPSQRRNFASRLARSGVACLLSASLVLSSLTGCTTRTQRIGPDDGSDACRAYVVALDSTGNYFAEDMIKGAALGALGGALIGGLAGGNWQSALIGAAAGAVAGGLGGYWKSKMDQAKDQAVPSMISDMKNDEAQLDKTQAAFKNLSACRREEAKKVRGLYASKAISREEAQTRLRLLATQARRDVDILNGITGDSDKRLAEFQYAANQIDSSVPPPSSASTPTPAPAPTQRNRTSPTRPAARTPAAATFSSLQAKQASLKQDGAAYAQEAAGFETSLG